MRRLIAIATLCAPLLALGQESAQEADCMADPASCAPPASPDTLPQPPCWPANFRGAGSLIYSGATDVGTWHFWYCPTSSGAWQGFGLVLAAGSMLIHPREPRSSPAATAAAYWALNARKAATPDELAIKAVMDAVISKYQQWAYAPPAEEMQIYPTPRPDVPPPAEIAWLTTGLTTYRSEGGGLSGFAGIGRRGAQCDCAQPILVGAVIHCTFEGAPAPDVVAACQRQQ